MDHFEIEVSEVNQPPCLATVECLGLPEIGKIFVIREDLHRKGGTMKVMLPQLQGADDREKFVIVDVVVTFCRGERLGEVGVGMPVSIGISLEKDGAGRILQSIHSNSESGRKGQGDGGQAWTGIGVSGPQRRIGKRGTSSMSSFSW